MNEHLDCLRNVMLGETGYRLQLWDLRKVSGDFLPRNYLAYAFFAPGSEEPLFAGDDFSPSPLTAIDSDEALVCLVGFLTMRPGDTDEEWFESYTEKQLEFANGKDIEWLQMYGIEDIGDDEFKPEFIDVE